MGEIVSALELEWRTSTTDADHGGKDKAWLEFVIDGEPLGETVGVGVPYKIGCLGWCVPEEDRMHVQQLLLDEPSDLETGRTRLYVCWICADIYCGAVTVAVEETFEHIIWKEFGFEGNYRNDDEPLISLDDYKHVGPFRFAKQQYREALLNRPAKPAPGNARRGA